MTDCIKSQGGVQSTRKIRNSNLELFRILTMLSIVAHHYVVNSGLLAADGVINSNPTSLHSLVLLLVGAWGKIGINSFVLITGYFMCKSNITLKKFLKLFFEIMFYRIVVAAVFWVTGYSAFSIRELVKVLIPIKDISTGFTSTYLVFFLFIPFLNILIHNLNERQHICLLLLCGFLYVFLGTVPYFSVTFNYVSWFIVLYFISSYIRLYPKRIYKNNAFWSVALFVMTLLCAASVIGCDFLFKGSYYLFVTDSNTLLAVLESVCAFMFFNNLKIKNSKVINVIASATFGVLLIHANSDTMRSWLWGDLLNVVGVHTESNGYLHILLSVLGIYFVCTVLDLIRIYVLEKPIFNNTDNLLEKINRHFCRLQNSISNKLNIM